MIKRIFLLFFVLVNVMPRQAKAYNNNLCISYGAISGYEFSTGLISALGGSEEKEFLKPRSGNIFLTYYRTVNRAISVGLTFGYRSLDYTLAKYEPNPINYYSNFKPYTLCFEMKFKYIIRKNIEFYGVAGVGATTTYATKYTTDNGSNLGYMASEPDSPTQMFSCQITPAGLRFGRKLCGFIEIGMGYKGLLNAGINLRF